MKKKLWTNLLAGLIGLIGIGFLFLTNNGFISLRRPYVFAASRDAQLEAESIAFVDVSVVPMDSERIIEHQTVVVRDGSIVEVADADSIAVPANAQVIDGQGRYLMPGLIDMHVHTKEENDLLLFVANGVTSVRDMWGSTGFKMQLMGAPDQLELRRQIQAGELLGPTIYQAGPLMEGDPPTSPLMPVFSSPEQAAESIRWQAEQGYDFVKVYDHLDPQTYQTILDTAEAVGLPVIGHAPSAVAFAEVLDGGQLTIEHLQGFIDADAATYLIPQDQHADYAHRSREAGVYFVPTLGIYPKLVNPEALADLEVSWPLEYVSPRMRQLWRLFMSQLQAGQTYQGDDYSARIEAMFISTTGTLHEEGALLLAGTDCGNPYVIPGFSMHDELAYLVEAGLTPYEALQAGTTRAAEAMGEAGKFGAVIEGQRADLLLLDANPLDDIANTRQISGVMTRGIWFSGEQIDQMLDGLIASYKLTLFDRVWPVVLFAPALIRVWRRVTA